MHFWCHDTTLKKIFSIEKLKLTWNRQTNSNKLDPFSRVFQIALSSRGWGWDICQEEFSEREWFWPLKSFSKLKTTFCEYWTLIKIKTSMTCEYKDYECKTKMVQEQWLQLKKKFLLDYENCHLVGWEEGWTFGGENKNLVEGSLLGVLFLVW